MGNDERPKMSWRDIDKSRDGSGGGRGSSSSHSGRPGGGPRGGGGRGEDPHQKQYRAALEAAFAKGELGKLADKLAGRANEEVNRPSLASLASAIAPQAERPNLSERASATERAVSAPAPGSPPGGEESADSEAARKKAAAKKKPGEDRPTLHRKLLEAPSRHEISKAAERYLARYPMPDDHEFLEQLLDHEQEARIKEALLRITQLLDRRLMPRRTRALIGKLRYLTETTADEEIRDKAQALLSRLS